MMRKTLYCGIAIPTMKQKMSSPDGKPVSFHNATIAKNLRYYANAVLDHVHRSKALEEWVKILRGENVPLERALGSFDLFVLHDQYGDLLEVQKWSTRTEQKSY
jgi:hypothetical protein